MASPMRRNARSGSSSAATTSMRSCLRMSSADPNVPGESIVMLPHVRLTQFRFLVRIYDARKYFSFKLKDKRPRDLEFDNLESLPLWKQELPFNSFIAVLFTPNSYTLNRDETWVGFNLYSVVLLALEVENKSF